MQILDSSRRLLGAYRRALPLLPASLRHYCRPSDQK
jgi:hypothetical protein